MTSSFTTKRHKTKKKNSFSCMHGLLLAQQYDWLWNQDFNSLINIPRLTKQALEGRG